MPILALNNPFYTAYYQSDLLGKGIFLGLYALSLLTWSLILYKGWLTWQARKHAHIFKKIFEQKRLSPLEIEVQSKERGGILDPFAKLYVTLRKHTLEILTKNRDFGGRPDEPSYLSSNDIEVVEGHLYSTIASQTQFLEKNLYILGMVIGLAPFLGLLGTVWGILLTFSELQMHQATGSSQAFLGGISLALATTVVGLFNAIPALIGYNYLKNCVGDMVVEMEGFSHEMLATVEMQYRRVELK